MDDAKKNVNSKEYKYESTNSGGTYLAGKLNSSNIDAILQGVDDNKFMNFGSDLPEDSKAGYYVANLSFVGGGLDFVHVHTKGNKNEIMLLGLDIVIKGNVYNPKAKPCDKQHITDLLSAVTDNTASQVIVKVGKPVLNKTTEKMVQYCDIVKEATWIKLSKRGAKLINGKNVALDNMAKSTKVINKTVKEGAEQKV